MTEERATIARAAAALGDPGVTREAPAPRAVDPLREAIATQLSEGLGAILRKFCDSTAAMQARHYLHAMPNSDWNTLITMLSEEIAKASRAALAAAPQPAPVEREKLVGVIRSDQRQLLSDYDGSVEAYDCDPEVEAAICALLDLIAAGLCLPGAVQPDETFAWAVVGDDGVPSLVSQDRVTAMHLGGPGERVVRVAIRRVEDEA